MSADNELPKNRRVRRLDRRAAPPPLVQLAQDGEGQTAVTEGALMQQYRDKITELTERCDKFKWQVRDTCVRAEQAESSLAALTRRLADEDALLNRAVSVLMQAIMNEDGIDPDDAIEVAEAIQKRAQLSGKTTDWHRCVHFYDSLCSALGIDNGDEIDVLPLVRKAIAERDTIRQQLTDVIAAAKVEAANMEHDITRLHDSLNAEVNARIASEERAEHACHQQNLMGVFAEKQRQEYEAECDELRKKLAPNTTGEYTPGEG